jgi:hypothetical protein
MAQQFVCKGECEGEEVCRERQRRRRRRRRSSKKIQSPEALSLSLQNGLIPNPRLPNLKEEVR